MTITDIATAANLTIVDQEAYGARVMLWVWDGRTLRTMEKHITAAGGIVRMTQYDPRRPGQVGLVIEQRRLMNDER